MISLTVSVPFLPGRSRRWVVGLIALVIGGSVLTGCGPTRPTTIDSLAVMPASTGVSLVIEPADHDGTIDRLVSGADRSIDVALYRLADPTVERLLVAAHRRGVEVRILLDRAYGGAVANRPAVAALRSAGVPTRWAADDVVLHQKTVVVDRTVAAVMTGNLTSTTSSPTRDFVAIDHDPTAIGAIESVFAHDWGGTPVGPGPRLAGLVWSPGSTGPLVALIDSARHTLVTENEEMEAPAIEASLAAAVRRGVAVRVIMTSDRRWHRVWSDLRRVGVDVVVVPEAPGVLYIHAKVLVVDDAVAFVGSQNFSDASLGANRELGVITTEPAVVRPLAATLAGDATLG